MSQWEQSDQSLLGDGSPGAVGREDTVGEGSRQQAVRCVTTGSAMTQGNPLPKGSLPTRSTAGVYKPGQAWGPPPKDSTQVGTTLHSRAECCAWRGQREGEVEMRAGTVQQVGGSNFCPWPPQWLPG